MASQNTPFKSGSTSTQRKKSSRPINGNGNGNGAKKGSSICLSRQASESSKTTESDSSSSKFSRVNEQFKIQPFFGAKGLSTTKSVGADKADNAKTGDAGGGGAKSNSITTWSPLSDGIVTICSSPIPNIDVPMHEEMVKSVDECIDNALYDDNRKAKPRLSAFKDFCPE